MEKQRKGRWKVKWSRNRACAGGAFIRPRKKKWVFVEGAE